MNSEDIDRLAGQAERASGDLGRAVPVMPGQLAELCRLARERLEQDVPVTGGITEEGHDLVDSLAGVEKTTMVKSDD